MKPAIGRSFVTVSPLFLRCYECPVAFNYNIAYGCIGLNEIGGLKHALNDRTGLVERACNSLVLLNKGRQEAGKDTCDVFTLCRGIDVSKTGGERLTRC